MIGILISLYSLLVIISTVLSYINIPANKWTELLHSLVDPALQVTRDLMKKYLPKLCGKGIDWSPLVLVVALWVLGLVVGLFSKLPLIGWLF